MPYWEIFTPRSTYTPDDKKGFAAAITEACVGVLGVPAFYVVVRFHEYAADEMYVGGKAEPNFIRVVTETIARRVDADDGRAAVMAAIEDAMAPYVKDRGFSWEVHVDETPRDLWRVQGLVPPPSWSDTEKIWAKENRPVPYELAKPSP